MDMIDIIKIVFKMVENIFLKGKKYKKLYTEWKLNKDDLLNDLENKARHEIDIIDEDIKELKERFNDYKAAGVDTDKIVKRLSDLDNEKNIQNKKLKDIKTLKETK